MIKAEIVAHSLSPQGDELISILCTFPRIILAEVNTHRMLSKNTSSSRAIPFSKMIEAVKNNPFIPIAWQKEHKGMQGSEYHFYNNSALEASWLEARDNAIVIASEINEYGVTKQLCNRLLEPFIWTTMLITGSREGWQNFFELRCPSYQGIDDIPFKSKKEYVASLNEKPNQLTSPIQVNDYSELEWLKLNKGQAEIHMMVLAEEIYNVVNESTPKQLEAGEWHIPMIDKIPFVGNLTKNIDENNTYWKDYDEQNKVKISVALSARTSYTVVGDEKEIDYSKMIELHDRLIAQNPPHSSPLEHCARAMSDDEYERFVKGYLDHDVIAWSTPIPIASENSQGWCNNLKGFIPYRYFIDNKIDI